MGLPETFSIITASDAVKRKLNLVVVDDCSPVPVSMPDGLNVNHRLVRIDRDIKWNSGGAKTLEYSVVKPLV